MPSIEDKTSGPGHLRVVEVTVSGDDNIRALGPLPSKHARVIALRAVEFGELEHTVTIQMALQLAANIDSRRKTMARLLAAVT